MTLKANGSQESGRRKFFMNSTYITLESRNQTFLVSRARKEFNSHQLARIGEEKISRELDVHHV